MFLSMDRITPTTRPQRGGRSTTCDLSCRSFLIRPLLYPLSDQQVDWNGKDARGRTVASGVYFYAIRKDNSVYIGGPGRLREVGITHINSPTWALVRLVPLNKLID